MGYATPARYRKVAQVHRAPHRLVLEENESARKLLDNARQLMIYDEKFHVGDWVYILTRENVDLEELDQADPCEKCNSQSGPLYECNCCFAAWCPKCSQGTAVHKVHSRNLVGLQSMWQTRWL